MHFIHRHWNVPELQQAKYVRTIYVRLQALDF